MLIKRLTFFILLISSFVFVFGLEDGYCVDFHVTSIEPSSVGQDEDFTVGIEIDNCGSKISEDIVFEITRYSEDINIKESLVSYVGEMSYSNSKRFLIYHMRSEPDAAFGEHVFSVKMTYGGNGFYFEKFGNFSVNVNVKEPELFVSGVRMIPEDVEKGDRAVMVIDVENSGSGVAKNVRAKIRGFAFPGSFDKYVGKIEAYESFPVRFVFDAKSSGIIYGDLVLSYEFAGEIVERVFPIEIYVFPKSGYGLWIGIAVVLVLAGGYYFFFRKK